ncbi:MAG: DNA-directed RNA polymerase subunit alpha [bacterium]|nr:DNA-directed RNA polymerase subunit alpha [bacterium]
MIGPNFKVSVVEEKSDYGVFALEPLDQGYGHTLGNSLRRVLLTSLEGAAVTAIKIGGSAHEFETIKGLKEDVIQLILNIKQINLKLSGEKTAKMSLSVKGPKNIVAGDIEVPSSIEIINKDLYLGSLADEKSKLEIEFTVEAGCGYSLAEERRTGALKVIPVDAQFSPVRRVNYTIDLTRVGRVTNFDKLTLFVWTNGTITAKEAFLAAARILAGHYEWIYNPREIKVIAEEQTGRLGLEDPAKTSIEELELSTRVTNSLKEGGIITLKDLLEKPKKELLKIKNLGGKSIVLIEEKLKEKGYSRGEEE